MFGINTFLFVPWKYADYTQWSRSKLASIGALLFRYTEGCVNVNQNFAYVINIVHKNDTEKPSVQEFKTALLSNAEYCRSYHNLEQHYSSSLFFELANNTIKFNRVFSIFQTYFAILSFDVAL